MSLYTHLSHQIPRRGVREDRKGWAAVIRGPSDTSPDDWDHVCGNNCGKESGKFFLYNDCSISWCRRCLERTVNDVGSGDGDGGFTGWRCPECQAAFDQQRHVSEDVQLDDDQRIVEEIMNVARVCGLVPGALAELPDDECGGSGGADETREDAYGAMLVAVLRDLLASCGLSKQGVKAVLVDRLRVDDVERQAAAGGGGGGGGGGWRCRCCCCW
jgi:hypothetical protein